MKELTVKSLSSLLDQVLDIKKQVGKERFLWFRGHSCNEYKLVSKLMRGAPSTEAVFERERRLVTRFRQRSLPFWPAGYPQTDWEHMFAMQHHGVPTRLLDWSENLFVAAYFAFQKTERHGASDDKQHEANCRSVVYCLDPVGWNRNIRQFSDMGDAIAVLTTTDDELKQYEPETSLDRLRKRPKSPVAIYGTHNSPRIVAQRGTFTVAGTDLAPMESYAGGENDATRLWRVVLDGDRETFMSDLSALGFTESMVFPDLTGLSRELDISEGWRK